MSLLGFAVLDARQVFDLPDASSKHYWVIWPFEYRSQTEGSNGIGRRQVGDLPRIGNGQAAAENN